METEDLMNMQDHVGDAITAVDILRELCADIDQLHGSTFTIGSWFCQVNRERAKAFIAEFDGS